MPWPWAENESKFIRLEKYPTNQSAISWQACEIGILSARDIASSIQIDTYLYTYLLSHRKDRRNKGLR